MNREQIITALTALKERMIALDYKEAGVSYHISLPGMEYVSFSWRDAVTSTMSFKFFYGPPYLALAEAEAFLAGQTAEAMIEAQLEKAATDIRKIATGKTFPAKFGSLVLEAFAATPGATNAEVV